MAPANPELRELIKEMNRSGLAARFKKHDKEILTAEGEIFPSAVLPVLATGKTGGQHVFPMKWGFAMKNRLLTFVFYVLKESRSQGLCCYA